MKTFNLILMLVLVATFQVSATVYIVNNTPGANAQFLQLQPAHDAASPGDTLYISGSSVKYDGLNMTKMLTIIGPGFKPSNIDLKPASISDITLLTGSSGSHFIGIKVDGQFSCTNNIDDIKLIKSRLAVQMRNGRNWLISGCIIIGGISNNTGGGDNLAVIRNNIMNGSVDVRNSSIYNNIFLQTGQLPISGVNLIVSNNVFYNTSFSRTLNSIYNNNIFTTTISAVLFVNLDENQPGSNSATGNFIGNDPQFVNVPDNSFNLNNDYSLSASSVGKNAGTDGTDIGIFGGAGFSTTGEPSLPVVTTLLIKNATLPENGELQVEVKGKANN